MCQDASQKCILHRKGLGDRYILIQGLNINNAFQKLIDVIYCFNCSDMELRIYYFSIFTIQVYDYRKLILLNEINMNSGNE